MLVFSDVLEQMHGTNWGKILIIAFGFITLGCSLSLFALLLGLEPGTKRQVVFENEGGSVGVALDAVEDFIKRKCSNITGVRDLQVRAEEENGELRLQTKVVLELQRNVPDFSREFQQRIHRELEETLGFQNIKEVKVLIHKIFPREAPKEPVLLSAPSQVILKDDEEVEPKETVEENRGEQSEEDEGDEVVATWVSSEDEKKEKDQ